MRVRFADAVRYPGDGWRWNGLRSDVRGLRGFGAAAVSFGRPTLKQWDKGPDVADLQEMLNAELGTSLETDGIFGPGTHDAVRHFQAKVYLKDDGVVGPDTWAKLGQPASGKTLPPASGGSGGGGGGGGGVSAPPFVPTGAGGGFFSDPVNIGALLLGGGLIAYFAFFGGGSKRSH